MSVPDWVQDAVFYQIFPDRFANGDPDNDPPNVVPWDSRPTRWNFFGGDLKGVIEHFDYLLDLGITALYFTPIFLSSSNHRYNATDYFKIDPMLGDMEDFKQLLAVAHRHGVRVMLDGVFNHCGRGFFAFSDILENSQHSPYKDWFHILHYPVDAYSPGDAVDYIGWWHHKSLPKFNTQHPPVREYLFSVARYWAEQGIDGWRLDVPNEIDDDDFWAEFRQIVRAVNPELYILGEIWESIPRWVGEKTFDALMNYPLRSAIIDFLMGKITASNFGEQVEFLTTCYPPANVLAMYNQIGSHDTERILTMLEGDLKKVSAALVFQFAFPGAPAVYYGDEIGITGGKDPDCRKTFPWDSKHWHKRLRDLVKRLIALRKKHAALRRGDFERLYLDDANQVYVFRRQYQGETILAALNASAHKATISISLARIGWQTGAPVYDLLTGSIVNVKNEELVIRLGGHKSILFGQQAW